MYSTLWCVCDCLTICLLVSLGTLMNRHALPIEVKVIAVISIRHEHHFVLWWETTGFSHCCQLHFLHVEPHWSLYTHVEGIWPSVVNMVHWQWLLTVVQRSFILVFLLWNSHKKCRFCNKQNNCEQSHTLEFPLNFYIITNLSRGRRKHWQTKSILFNEFLIVLL